MKYLKLFEYFFIPKFTSKDSLEYKAKLKTPIDINLFENFYKANSIIKNNNLNQIQLDNIEKIKNSVKSGYIGKLVQFYIEEKIDFEKIEWVCNHINNIKLSHPIDSYVKFSILESDLKFKEFEKVISKIRKINNIPNVLDNKKIFKEITDFNLNIEKYINLPIFGKIKDTEDFLKIIKNDFKNFKYHKDWKILLDNDKYLVYEILSYEGAMHLIHIAQCIRHENMYNSYKRNNTKFYNFIDKENIDISLFLDIDDRKIEIFKWDDKHLLKISTVDNNFIIKNRQQITNILNENNLNIYLPKINILIDDIFPKIL